MIAGFAWKKKLGAGAPFTNTVDPRSLVYPVSTLIMRTLIILEPIISTLTIRTLTLRTLTMLRRSACRQRERSAGDRARC